MPKLIMLKGLPASGKTTLAMQMVRQQGAKRVNKDDLRQMLDGGRYSETKENFILQVRDAIISLSLKNGFDAVVDDTNLAQKHQDALAELAETHGVEFEEISCDTPLEECIRRDAERENSIGEEVIRQMHRTHLRNL